MAPASALLALLLFAPQQDLVSDGLKALDTNQPATAEALFRRAIESAPNDVAAHFNLALALSLEEKDAEAIAELRRTLELKPDIYEAQTNLATLLLRNSRAPEAVTLLTPATSAPGLTPQQSERIHLLLAQALEASGDLAQASDHYRKTLEADAKSAPAHAGLAHIALLQSNLPEAAEQFRSAAAVDPRYSTGLLDVAAAYEKSAKTSEAIAIYRQFPENAGAQQRLAHLLAESGDARTAIPALESAVEQAPTIVNRLALADAYKSDKQAGKAIRQLQLAVASEPSNYEVRMALGRELRDQRRFVPAAEQFSAAAQLHPDSAKAWNELAAVLVVSEDYARGLAALDHVRALGQELPGDFFYRAISLEKLRQPKPALEAYRQFLATDAGKMPDQEFQARQRIRLIESELKHR